MNHFSEIQLVQKNEMHFHFKMMVKIYIRIRVIDLFQAYYFDKQKINFNMKNFILFLFLLNPCVCDNVTQKRYYCAEVILSSIRGAVTQR